MLKNRFEAKMYLKWLLVCDRNNCVSEYFEEIIGYKPFSAYDVIMNESFLDEEIEISKDFDIEEMGIEKDVIKDIIKEKLHSEYL